MRLEGLRERLRGTYDLDRAEDCRKVIQVLMRGSDRAHVTAEEARRELKALALDVVNERVSEAQERAAEALREADSGREPRERGPAEVVDFIAAMAGETARAEDLSDAELCDEVLNGLWAHLDMHGRDSAVLSELVRRLREGLEGPDSDEEPAIGEE